MTRYLAIAACCALLSAPANAARHSDIGDQWDNDVVHRTPQAPTKQKAKRHAKQKVYRITRKVKPAYVKQHSISEHITEYDQTFSPTITGYQKEVVKHRGKSLNGVVYPLRSKIEQIVSSCGSTVISAVRNTFIAGTKTKSLHASGRAVDIAGGYGCAYALLRGWPSQGGGYTTDYKRVNHIHISYGGPEAGKTFAHGYGKKRTRYAKRYKRTKVAVR